MKVDLLRIDGRLRLWFNEKTIFDAGPELLGNARPGAVLEVECRHEPGRGFFPVRVVEELSPGGRTPLDEIRCYLDRGHTRLALAHLGDGELRDPELLAARVRGRTDAGDLVAAHADFAALADLAIGTPLPEPYDLASLAAALPAPPPALAAWVTRTRLAPGSPAVQRALDLVPPSAWTTPQLFARLSQPATSSRDLLQTIVSEAKARGLDVTVAETVLARVVDGEDKSAAEKRAHHAMRAALRGLRKTLRPPPPYHLGGPAPRVSTESLVGLARWCAESVAAACPPEQRPLFDRLLIADAFDGTPFLPAASPLTVAYHAYQARVLAGTPQLVRTPVNRAATTAARILKSAAFVLELDRRLCEAESRALATRIRGGPPVETCLWRGGDDEELAHVLFRTPGANLALLSRVARRWRWFTGTRDDVLSTIPDRHFAAACKSLV